MYFKFFYKKLIKFIMFFSFFVLVFNNIVLSQDTNLMSPPNKSNIFSDLINFKNKIINYFSQLIKKILSWFKKIWDFYIFPFFHKIWRKSNLILKKEIGERKPQVQKELKEEAKEFKQEVPLFFKNFWQKSKEFLKFNILTN